MKILRLVKRLVLAILIIYAFNFLLKYVNIFIPINIPSILTVTILGIPGYLGLMIVNIFMKWGYYESIGTIN